MISTSYDDKRVVRSHVLYPTELTAHRNNFKYLAESFRKANSSKLVKIRAYRSRTFGIIRNRNSCLLKSMAPPYQNFLHSASGSEHSSGWCESRDKFLLGIDRTQQYGVLDPDRRAEKRQTDLGDY